MNGIKLLVFDLDGTLLGPDHRVPERVRSLILALREDVGIETTLATGRPYAAVERFVDELDLRLPLIVFNGAAVVMPDGEVLSLRPLPIAQAKTALHLLGETSAANHAYLRPADTRFLADRLGPAADHIVAKDGMRPELVENLGAFLDSQDADPIKIFSIGPREELEAVQAAFRAAVPEATCVFSEHDMLEFLGHRVTKGTALSALCDIAGIDVKDVAAFGDNLNDLDMLRVAGFAVSMAAAPDAMRMEADGVTDDLCGYLEANFGHFVGKEQPA